MRLCMCNIICCTVLIYRLSWSKNAGTSFWKRLWNQQAVSLKLTVENKKWCDTKSDTRKRHRQMVTSTHNPHLHTSIPQTKNPIMLMSRDLNQPIRLYKPSSNHPSTYCWNEHASTDHVTCSRMHGRQLPATGGGARVHDVRRCVTFVLAAQTSCSQALQTHETRTRDSEERRHES